MEEDKSASYMAAEQAMAEHSDEPAPADDYGVGELSPAEEAAGEQFVAQAQELLSQGSDPMVLAKMFGAMATAFEQMGSQAPPAEAPAEVPAEAPPMEA